MTGFKYYARISVLLLLLMAFLLIATARLYNLQIVHGEDNLKQAERRLVRTVTIPAARGEILDRYGRPLVKNRLSYDVTIDMSRMKLNDPPEILSRLIALMRAEGIAYEDTFPVTAPPYAYVSAMTDKQKSRLERYLKEKEWVGVTAIELMEKLRDEYKIDERFDDAQARDIAAIRYELELRTLFFNYPVYKFATDVDMALVAKISEQDFPGVMIETVPIREYLTEYAAHLLGRVGQIFEEDAEMYKELGYAADEIVGVDGLEKTLESYLHGTAGSRTEETTTSGKVTSVLKTTPPEPGKNVMLTIDIHFQEQVEKILESNILRMREEGQNNTKLDGGQSEGGAAVVLDVKSAAVLASASYPSFDLENYKQDIADMLVDSMTPLVNRAIQGTYEPGSTFKMATAIAALETGAITPRTIITDQGRYMRFAPSYTPSCSIYRSSGSTHGSLNVANALRVSCNYFFYEAGWLAGIDAMNNYATQLGLGETTGVELPGERAGILAGPAYVEAHPGMRSWAGGDVIQAAIGQSYNLFTPMQLANYVSVIANGGSRYRCHLLQSVKSYDYAQTVYEAKPELLNFVAMSDEALDTVREGMKLVASPSGTASRTFGSFRIPVAAKTGSAQVKADGTPANGVFVVYAPADDPQIAIAVVVEKGGAGSAVAPIARDIIDAYFSIQDEMETVPTSGVLCE